jgi:hypothetical protein
VVSSSSCGRNPLRVSAVNPLVAFYDINGRKGQVIIFCSVPDTTRDKAEHIIMNFIRDTLNIEIIYCFWENKINRLYKYGQQHVTLYTNAFEIRAVQCPKCIV